MPTFYYPGCDLCHADKQIILYCKDWFKKTDLITDLKVLVGKRAAIEPENISVYDIYKILYKLVLELNNSHKMKLFFGKLFRYNKTIDIIKMIEFCANNPENYTSKQWNKKINELIEDVDEWLDEEIIEDLTYPYLMHCDEF